MTDKELLELAAKAAGIEIKWDTPYKAVWDFVQVPDWNPLTDDGDALRLAVTLNLAVHPTDDETWVVSPIAPLIRDAISEAQGNDPYAATRRAIVRAAAEIGKEIAMAGAGSDKKKQFTIYSKAQAMK